MDGAALTLTSSKKEHRDDELLTHAPSGDVGFQHRKEATRPLPRGDLIKGSGRTFLIVATAIEYLLRHTPQNFLQNACIIQARLCAAS